jgi:hypothetical protein
VDKSKDTKKLKAEELEKRVAPASLTYSDPTATGGEATTSTKAGGKDKA